MQVNVNTVPLTTYAGCLNRDMRYNRDIII